jgi:hypothetical protein
MISRGEAPYPGKGISYSTLKPDTTMTTDSVHEERRVIQGQIESEDKRANSSMTGEGERLEDIIEMGRAIDTTAPLLKYDDLFKSEKTSLYE